MIYDFILFENLYNVQNHYKDLNNFAILLKKAGYNVAIADAFKEADLCKVEAVPHIKINIKCPSIFKTLYTYQKKQSGLSKFYYRVRKDYYMYKVLKFLNPMTSNIYAGSLTLATPIYFVKAFSKNNNYYMWALRSANVLRWQNGIHGFSDLVSKMLFINLNKYQNLSLLVSNSLIRDEFLIKVGIEERRLILRPERFVLNKTTPDEEIVEQKSTLHLLFIGTLRPFKNVEFCMRALEKLNNPDIFYTIAGRCKRNSDEKYNRFINEMAGSMKNVQRIDRYISDEEYNALIKKCDFLVLCDKTQASCASNGTMSEALLAGKPIIAPDFNPFKYEVEKYGVGYLYKYENIDSLCEVLMLALQNGAYQFKKQLTAYRNMFLIENVAKNLADQLKNSSMSSKSVISYQEDKESVNKNN
nr:glycosyltransferase [uncultured Prevotella sp.]